MEKLIPVVNKLQDIFYTAGVDYIGLPQIVVVGAQSSGKSSVLEGVVGRHFLPRGTGIVTRRPLVLQLINSKKLSQPSDLANVIKNIKLHDDSKASFNGELSDKEFGCFLHIPNKVFYNYEDIEQEIINETNRVAGSGKLINNEPIRLKIYSPIVTDLTLVDLPGLTKIPVGDQPDDIEVQIYDMVCSYIKNPNSIILAVSPGNVDLATSEALKLAKQVDPTGIRTIAVITKLDIMDKGTNAMDILTGKLINVQLGIIGVVNRSQLDITQNKDIQAALKDEKDYFNEYYPLLAAWQGIPYLVETLSKILLEHIVKCLPELKIRIGTLLSQFQHIADSYGENISDKRQLLLQLLTKFSSNYIDIVRGTTRNLTTAELCGGARIYYIFHEVFGKKVSSMSSLMGLTRNDILTAIRNTMGSKPALFVPELAFEMLVQRQISRLEDPSLSCVDLVHDEMQRAIQNALSMSKEMSRFPSLRDKLVEVMSQLLENELKPTIHMVKSLVQMELAYVNTNHPDFLNVAQMTSKLLRESDSAALRNEPKDNAFEIVVDKKRVAVQMAPTSSSPIDQATLKTSSSNKSMNVPIDDSVKNSLKNMKDGNTKRRLSQYVSQSESKDELNAQLIELLIKSYMELIKKKFQDSVPKAISCFLINKVLGDVSSELVRTLYKEDLLDYLLQESESSTQKRTNAMKMIITLKRALTVINELKDTQINT